MMRSMLADQPNWPVERMHGLMTIFISATSWPINAEKAAYDSASLLLSVTFSTLSPRWSFTTLKNRVASASISIPRRGGPGAPERTLHRSSNDLTSASWAAFSSSVSSSSRPSLDWARSDQRRAGSQQTGATHDADELLALELLKLRDGVLVDRVDHEQDLRGARSGWAIGATAVVTCLEALLFEDLKERRVASRGEGLAACRSDIFGQAEDIEDARGEVVDILLPLGPAQIGASASAEHDGVARAAESRLVAEE
jgi:hypothetical protein